MLKAILVLLILTPTLADAKPVSCKSNTRITGTTQTTCR